jgi:hypothetical protein
MGTHSSSPRGVAFPPAPAQPQTAGKDWAAIRRASYWGNSRRFRRFVVLLWVAMLALDPWMVSRLVRTYSILGILPSLLLPTLTQLAITWLAFRGAQVGLAQPTIEDSALMEHGTDFEALSNHDREQLFRQRLRTFLAGKAHRDERETELRLRSESAAYRLLRPGLAFVVAVYWVICLLGPFAQVRATLAITAIAVTWIAVAVLVLPTLIRMWTQPNEAGETRIVKERATI